MTNTQHTAVAHMGAAFCSCKWTIDYTGNKYMTEAQQYREAERAATLHPIREANRHHETVATPGGYTGD